MAYKYILFFYTHHKRNFKGVVFELSCPCSYLVQGLAMHFFLKKLIIHILNEKLCIKITYNYDPPPFSPMNSY